MVKLVRGQDSYVAPVVLYQVISMNRIYLNMKIYTSDTQGRIYNLYNLSLKLPKFCRQMHHTLSVWVCLCLPKPCHSWQNIY